MFFGSGLRAGCVLGFHMRFVCVQAIRRERLAVIRDSTELPALCRSVVRLRERKGMAAVCGGQVRSGFAVAEGNGSVLHERGRPVLCGIALTQRCLYKRAILHGKHKPCLVVLQIIASVAAPNRRPDLVHGITLEGPGDRAGAVGIGVAVDANDFVRCTAHQIVRTEQCLVHFERFCHIQRLDVDVVVLLIKTLTAANQEFTALQL